MGWNYLSIPKLQQLHHAAVVIIIFQTDIVITHLQ